MSRAGVVFLLALPVAAFLAASSCQDFPPVQKCGEIPGEGCPVGRGGTCDDVTCSALYDCVNGQWVLSQMCDQPDAGPNRDGGPGEGGPGGDGGPCTHVTIDLSGKTTGCTPELSADQGDCSVTAAEGCAESACLTGCSTFFVCLSAGWYDVAYCTDQGQLVVTRP